MSSQPMRHSKLLSIILRIAACGLLFPIAMTAAVLLIAAELLNLYGEL